MRRWLLLILLLMAAAPAVASEPPDSVSSDADAAQKARAAGDHGKLATLAKGTKARPWLVADLLLARGEAKTAAAYAAAAEKKVRKPLASYVAAYAPAEGHAALHKALVEAAAHHAGKRTKEGLSALRKAKPAKGTVAAARRAFMLALFMREAGATDEVITAFQEARTRAKAIGWGWGERVALAQIATTLYMANRHANAVARYEELLPLERRDGAPADLVATLESLAQSLEALDRYADSERRYREALEALGAKGDRATLARIAGGLAWSIARQQRYGEAIQVWLKQIELLGPLGDDRALAGAHSIVARVLRVNGRNRQSTPHEEKALALWIKLGEERKAAESLSNLGAGWMSLGSFAKAVEYLEKARDAQAKLGDEKGRAQSLARLGICMSRTGRLDRALELINEAHAIMVKLGDEKGRLWVVGYQGHTYQQLGRWREALACHREELAYDEAKNDKRGIMISLVNVANCLGSLREYDEAAAANLRVLNLARELGNPQAEAMALMNLGVVHERSGRIGKALDLTRQALPQLERLGDRGNTATALRKMGRYHWRLGAYDEAATYAQRALEAHERIGSLGGAAMCVRLLAGIRSAQGKLDDALALYDRAHDLYVKRGLPTQAAAMRGAQGSIWFKREEFEKAAAMHRKTVAAMRAAQDDAGVSVNLGHLAHALREMGQIEEATKAARESLASAREIENPYHIASSLHVLAAVDAKAGRFEDALAHVREALGIVVPLGEGLADEGHAALMDRWIAVFEMGALVALATKDAGAAVEFMEQGRAAALRESLGGREALRGTVVPEALRLDEAEASAALTKATSEYRQLRRTSKVRDLLRTKKAIRAAQDALLDVHRRIQEATKQSADLVYPAPQSVQELQAALKPGDALLLYGLYEPATMAVVITPSAARVVEIGRTDEIEPLCRELVEDAEDQGIRDGTAAKLRERIVKPLGLDKDVKRLLISPHGALAFVPFALLTPRTPFVYLASGTTYGLLRRETREPGKGVLALGDPDYGAAPTATAPRGRKRGGFDLERLAATRDEAKAVGDVVLLGKQATEAGLRKAIDGRAWRAVHLACHGFVHAKRPAFSSLALTPTAEDDGFLNMLEVTRLQLRADLVALSACETGRGRLYLSEGVVGLTRAFMLAGAPRVLVSLWEVDDEATRLFMESFYAAWKAGSTPATALLEAQSDVRGHVVWVVDRKESKKQGRGVKKETRPYEDPAYWAAWVLWGLPD